MSLDPDDPRPPYQQVSSALRAAILTRKEGFTPGDKLPSGPELARRYGVARGTVDKALDLLRGEGLIVTRQGSGSFVRERTERPVGLRPHLEAAFAEPNVTIDFAGFSSETLHNAMQEPLDKVRSGRLTPESVTVRLLLPDASAPMGVPVAVDGLRDEEALRRRAHNIGVTNAGGIKHSVEVLAEYGLVQSAKVEVRVHKASSLFKLYVLNEREAFFGFYPLRERSLTFEGESYSFFDITGKDTTLFHHSAGPDDASIGSQYVQQAQRWFNSVWDTIAYEWKA
ncbi:GntR family transcriptional regulator [Streptomyces clavuligerus]|uniref:Transcriptional regulator, GntR family n=1 Tax=Streptomyces clavuligerus TaxID=1901 RepID=B5GL96_STRCL|nr:GntR family transcriptional regulator [Streptomyces clavuligerus]ANW18111.1 GntR family transcriptional regulator [Streptomyces clavuligerus]AXU12672.1 GntR family transcriptional regulator [Streptomyces clavuligerus]EDY47092.1 transcriptional regulator [Streptomyces clavuligerus]EFG09299.1 Transcriptional regulator, GntR family [Streptomyces clavuligerus]MBY6302575.1 GntR family transcriptional regulator [Streptomyces clavuligerus]